MSKLLNFHRRLMRCYLDLPTSVLMATEGASAAFVWLCVALPFRLFSPSTVPWLSWRFVIVAGAIVAVWVAFVTRHILMEDDRLPAIWAGAVSMAVCWGLGLLFFSGSGESLAELVVRATIFMFGPSQFLADVLDHSKSAIQAHMRR